MFAQWQTAVDHYENLRWSTDGTSECERLLANSNWSDGTPSISVFTADYSLVGGEDVGPVVLYDGNEYSADFEDVRELQGAELTTIDESEDSGSFTNDGKQRLAEVMQALRGVRM